MIRRPFYETTYHCDGWRLADAFRPQPGWGTRTFRVNVADCGEHTEQQLLEAARQGAPDRHHLTSVKLYAEAAGDDRVIWSTPPDPRWRRACGGVARHEAKTEDGNAHG